MHEQVSTGITEDQQGSIGFKEDQRVEVAPIWDSILSRVYCFGGYILWGITSFYGDYILLRVYLLEVTSFCALHLFVGILSSEVLSCIT